MKKILLAIFCTLLLNATTIKEYHLGKTYDFKEQDLTELMKNTIANANINVEEIRNKFKERMQNYKPSNLQKLKTATKDRTRQFKVFYKLENDISNGAGGFIYYKNYIYNILDYIQLKHKYIVINATDEKELRWLKQSKYVNDENYQILLVDGSYYELSKELKKLVYFMPYGFKERARLEYTVSIVEQVGNELKVTEICTHCIKEKED